MTAKRKRTKPPTLRTQIAALRDDVRRLSEILHRRESRRDFDVSYATIAAERKEYCEQVYYLRSVIKQLSKPEPPPEAEPE